MATKDDGFDSPVDTIRHMISKGLPMVAIYAAMRPLIYEVEFDSCYADLVAKRGGNREYHVQGYETFCRLADGDAWQPEERTIKWVLARLDSLIDNRMRTAKRPRKTMNSADGLIGAVGGYIAREFTRWSTRQTLLNHDFDNPPKS